MKTTIVFLSLLGITLLFNSCKKDDAQPQSIANVLVNGDFESSTVYSDWGTYTGKVSKTKPNSYTIDYSTEASSSPSHSIKVSCAVAQNDSTYQYMQQLIYTSADVVAAYPGSKLTTIPAGSKLTFKVKIKTANIKGNGISIAMGGNYGASKNYASAFYISTEEKTSITGTNDFKEYTITFDSFPADVYSMYVLIFYLPNTVGTAYYDDASLSVN